MTNSDAQAGALSAYNDARKHLEICLAELQSTVHRGDKKRMLDCQQWTAEAIEAEQEAFARLRPYLNVQVVPIEAQH